MQRHRDNFEFRPLGEIPRDDIIRLMNHPLVRRHLPLARGVFDDTACTTFLKSKEELWVRHGYGPRAITIGGEFAGWGGLQPEPGGPEIALVLHPDHWGWGKRICQRILQQAFGEMRFESVTALLPPSRTNQKGLLRLGFAPDGEVEIEKHRFFRYRLSKTSKSIE